MKLLRFDSVGGASGDMILGTLIGLGVPAESLNRMLAGLGLGDVHIHAEPASSHGLNGLRVHVHAHDHAQDGGHHHHGEDRPAHGHHHEDARRSDAGHEHRGFTGIRAMIEGSDLPEAVKERAVAVFRKLGEAEAAIHGVPLESVHFHEVGAADSIADIVGACLGRELLGLEAVSVGPLPIGHGTVRCAHGVYPSPAPATLRLLRGMAVEEVDEPFETVTPTGAALLAAWKTHERIPAGFRPVQSAYAFGARQLQGRPNVLRATIYESTAAADADTCRVLECNLDDTTPELVGVLCEGLMQAGALDAFATAIQMKKQRPAAMLTVLCRAEDRERILERIFRGSTTFGVREYEASRTVLARRWVNVETPYGPVQVKIGTWKGVDITRAPEMDDCRRVAAERGIEVRAVYEAAFAAANAPNVGLV